MPFSSTASISSILVPYCIPAYLVFSKKSCALNSSSVGTYAYLRAWYSMFSDSQTAPWRTGCLRALFFPEPDGPTSATTDGFFIFLFLYNDAFIICSTRYTNSVILLTDNSPVIFEFHGFRMSTGYVAGVSSTLCMASSKIISNCTRFFALPSMIFSVGKSGKCLHYLARPHSHEARCHRSDKIDLSNIHELSYHPLCLFRRLLPLVKCIIPVKFLYDRGSAGILPGIYILQFKRWGDIIFLFAISMAILLNGAVTSSQSSPILGLIMLIPFYFVTIYNKKTCNNCKS